MGGANGAVNICVNETMIVRLGMKLVTINSLTCTRLYTRDVRADFNHDVLTYPHTFFLFNVHYYTTHSSIVPSTCTVELSLSLFLAWKKKTK